MSNCSKQLKCQTKFIYQAMDGPDTNWNVLQLVDDEVSDGDFALGHM